MTDLVKILVKTPFDPMTVATVFPFLHQVKLEYPDSQFHLITTEETEFLYKILPFEVYTYNYDEREKSLPAIHKFAVNQNEIFNIDLYFDLENSLKSSFLGFSFKAKERIGYVKGMNKLLLTHKTIPFDSYRPDKIHLNLLESFLEKKFQGLKISGIEKKEQLISKKLEELVRLPPYFLIKADDLLDHLDFWNDFFRFFEKQYFVIWFEPSLGEEKYNELQSYFKSLEQLNVYAVKTGPYDSLLRLIVHAVGFLTNDYKWSYFGSYLGIKTYSFVKKATDLPFMEHFEEVPVLIEMDESIPVKWISAEKNEPIETVDRLVNIIHDIHEL